MRVVIVARTPDGTVWGSAREADPGRGLAEVRDRARRDCARQLSVDAREVEVIRVTEVGEGSLDLAVDSAVAREAA